MTLRSLALSLLCLGLLSGCSGWHGGGEEPPLPGDRISVLLREASLSADPNVADLPVTLPAAVANKAWPQHGGSPAHRPRHPAGPKKPALAWKAEIGENAADAGQLLARPVVADGMVFAMDAIGSISAFDAKTGAPRWRTSSEDLELDESVFGGGLAYDQAMLFVTLTTGDVIGLNAKNGDVVWRQQLTLPLRRGADGLGRYRSGSDRRQSGLCARSGNRPADMAPFRFFRGLGRSWRAQPRGRWLASRSCPILPPRSMRFASTTAGHFGSDTLERPRRTQALAEINDIDGTPMIDGDRVYVGGRGGQVAAIDMRRGVRAWDADLTATGTPWIAGDFIYLLTEQNEVVCLVQKSGRIRWVTQMPLTVDPDDPSADVLTWRGPVLAGEQLYLTSSAGNLLMLSPQDGGQINRLALSAPGRGDTGDRR